MQLNKTVTLKIVTFILLVVFVIFIFIFTHYIPLNMIKSNSNLTCRSDMKINAEDASFEGSFIYKLGTEKGITNIVGNIISASGEEYLVERTVLLSFSNYGFSPVWTSDKVVISNKDSVPLSVADDLFPNIYIKPSEHSDIDMININASSFLITMAGIPYQYCTKIH